MSEIPQRLFSSAVAEYARYRTGYPPGRVAALAGLLGLDHTDTVLDVGCGTGQLAMSLAVHVGSVVAIDPVPEMLDQGRAIAQQASVDNISWLLGDSGDVETIVAPGARAATFAASFHWTDRPEVLHSLDRMLAGDGAIAIITDVLDDADDPDWVDAINALRDSYLSDGRSDPTEVYRKTPDSHRTVLAASAFSSIQSLTWVWSRELTVDEAVGLQFTYSFSTPALFGNRAAAFAADARDVILSMYPEGRVTEPFRMEVLVATRPGT